MTKFSTCCKVTCKRYFEGYIRADNKRGGKVVGMRYKCGACGMTQKKPIVKVMCEFHGKQTSINGCCPKCPQAEWVGFLAPSEKRDNL